jgi:hypothetical protein
VAAPPMSEMNSRRLMHSVRAQAPFSIQRFRT